MEIELNNDHDWDNVYWEQSNPRWIAICYERLRLYVSIPKEAETIYIVTAKKPPRYAAAHAYRIHGQGKAVRVKDHLQHGLNNWLHEAYRAGDRYAWIEY